jgi:hypothetical protein
MPLGEIVRDMLGKEKETNPVKRLYDDAFKADIGRWIASCAVIGLSAGIMSKHPGHNLLAASAYNLAVVGSLTCIYICISLLTRLRELYISLLSRYQSGHKVSAIQDRQYGMF